MRKMFKVFFGNRAAITDTLTITETVTGSAAATVDVVNAKLSISPDTGDGNSSQSVNLIGAGTVWTQENPTTLFAVSGGTSTLGLPTINNDLSASALFALEDANVTLTITDTSEGAQTTFDVSEVSSSSSVSTSSSSSVSSSSSSSRSSSSSSTSKSGSSSSSKSSSSTSSQSSSSSSLSLSSSSSSSLSSSSVSSQSSANPNWPYYLTANSLRIG